MISRFTLDSATEFLFGHDVKSLSAGLPYPSTLAAPVKTSALSHPANIVTRAFSQAQTEAAFRVRYGPFWPFFELSGDKTKKHMKVIDAFIEPVICDAIEKAKFKKSRGADAGVNEDEDNADTLLSHLVKMTDGPCRPHICVAPMAHCTCRSQAHPRRNSQHRYSRPRHSKSAQATAALFH